MINFLVHFEIWIHVSEKRLAFKEACSLILHDRLLNIAAYNLHSYTVNLCGYDSLSIGAVVSATSVAQTTYYDW